MLERSDIKAFIKRSPVVPFAVQLIQTCRSPRLQGEILQDYLRTRREAVFIRQTRFKPDPARKLLIASFSQEVYAMKMDAMLALGLRERGWTPITLVSRFNPWVIRYFRAYGMNDFIFWEDIPLSAQERRKCREGAEDFKQGELSIQKIKKWNSDGVVFGPQLLAGIIRDKHLGAPDFEKDEVRSSLYQLLPVSLEVVVRSRKLLKEVQPQMLLINEPNSSFSGPLTSLFVNEGVNVIQYVQPSRDDAQIFKRLTPETRRIHANSLSRESLEKLKNLKWTDELERELFQEFDNRYNGKWLLQKRNQPGVDHWSKDKIVQELKLDPAKKIAVVFSHILWDANLFFGDDLFEDYGDWFVNTVRAACANPQINWLIKLHPANLFKRARDNFTGELAEVALIRDKIGELPPHVKLLFPDVKISTLSLFQSIDYGITVRGTIGIELPCFGVPTITAGTGRYSGLGITVDSSTKEEYLTKLSGIQDLPRMTEDQALLAKKHAYGVFRLRPWVMKSFRAEFKFLKKGTHPLDHNLFSQVRSIQEMEQNGDLAAWADWAGSSGPVDYLDLDRLRELTRT